MSSVVRDAMAILIRDVKKSKRVLKQELERVADARAAGPSDEEHNERAEGDEQGAEPAWMDFKSTRTRRASCGRRTVNGQSARRSESIL
jgi:hypothetical protein